MAKDKVAPIRDLPASPDGEVRPEAVIHSARRQWLVTRRGHSQQQYSFSKSVADQEANIAAMSRPPLGAVRNKNSSR
jgi:hypothetical protein